MFCPWEGGKEVLVLDRGSEQLGFNVAEKKISFPI